MNGFVKLPRSDFDIRLHRHHVAFVLMQWLRAKARFKPGKVFFGRHDITLQKNQIVVGRNSLSIDLETTPKAIWCALKLLKAKGLIKIRSTPHYSVVEIVEVPPTIGTTEGTTQGTTKRQLRDN